MRQILSILCLLPAVACFEEQNIELPPPAEAPALISGNYELHVVSADLSQCQGMRPADLVGQEISVALKAHDSKVRLDAEGLVLHGEMADGFLSADGGYSDDMPVQAEEGDADTTTTDTGDSGSSSPSSGGGSSGSSGSSSGSSGGSSGSSGGSSRPSHGGGGAPSSFSVEIGLELDVRSDRVADGVLDYWMSDGNMECSFSAEVSMVFVGRGHATPVPVEDTDTTTDVAPVASN